jgi:hypothetical protein
MVHKRSRARLFWLVLPAFIFLLLPGKLWAAACPNVKGADKFFSIVRSKVHKKVTEAQVESYNCIFKYWHEEKLKDKRWLGYALATAWHESHMHPVREGFGSHAKAVAAARYAWNKGWPKKPYHLKHPETGKVYYGRGLVQITYAANYLKVGQQIGLGDTLYRNPDLALDPKIAVKLMFHGMRKGSYRVEKQKSIMRDCGSPVKKYVRASLGLYFNNKCEKWYRARNMINGDLKKTANKISRIGKYYLSGLANVPVPLAEEVPLVPEEPEVVPEKPGEEVQPGEEVPDIKPVPETADADQPKDTDLATAASGETADKDAEKPKDPEEKEIATDVTVKPATDEAPDDTPVALLEPDANGGTDVSTPSATDDTGTPAVTPDVTPADTVVDAGSLQELQAASKAQGEQIAALRSDLEAQGRTSSENKRALDSVNKRLDTISASIAQLSEQIAALSGEASSTTPPSDVGQEQEITDSAQPEATTEPQEQKWYSKYLGYVWKSKK